MADKVPVKATYDSAGDADGLSEYVSGDTLGFAHGGTGLAAVGSAGQVLRTNSSANAIEWGAAELINIDGMTDGSGITIADTDDFAISDAGTEKKINASQIKTYIGTPLSLIDEDDLSTDSATRPPSQQSVKAYVDGQTHLSLIDEDNMATDSATRPPSQQSVKAYTDGLTALTGGDLTIYEDANNADVSLKMGTSATEALSIEVLNGGSDKINTETKITTTTGDGTANYGKISIYIDETEIMDIDDGGIDMASGKTVALNGTDLVAPGLVFLEGATVSGDKGIDLDSCFTSTYRNYTLFFDGQGNDSGAEQLFLQLNAGGSADTTANSDYAGTLSYQSSGEAHAGQAEVDIAHFELIGNWIKDAAFSCVVDFIAPQVSDQTQIFSKVTTHYTDTEHGTQYGGGIKDETTAYDGFYLFCDDTQTLSGTYKLYGWANS